MFIVKFKNLASLNITRFIVVFSFNFIIVQQEFIVIMQLIYDRLAIEVTSVKLKTFSILALMIMLRIIIIKFFLDADL